MILLGAEEIRKWAAMIALSGIAGHRPRALVASSIIRARFCELIGTQTGLGDRGSELFLMGLFSLLDAILNQPFSAILPDLHLPADINNILLGAGDDYGAIGQLHGMARAFEQADWCAISQNGLSLKVPQSALIDGYYEAVRWANHLST